MLVEERHNPVGKRDYLSAQHLGRYKFALQYLKPGMRVLDIACGAGYGSAMFSHAGCDVIGGDYDEAILDSARKDWAGIHFQKADALNLPFEDASFDAVVSFETIEHVDDGTRFLSEMRRVLKPGGLYICSTPNIRYTSHPPFHIYEYEPEEFFSAVRKQFSGVVLWGQYFKRIDRVRDMLKWHVTPRLTYPLVKMLDAVGLKVIIKQLLKPSSAKRQFEVSKPAASLQSKNVDCNVYGDGFYDVKPLDDEHLLRIMLVVAHKQA